MATRSYDESSQRYEYPTKYISSRSAVEQAFTHAISVISSHGLAKDACVYGWDADKTSRINQYRGTRGRANNVGIITEVGLQVREYPDRTGYVQAILNRQYEV